MSSVGPHSQSDDTLVDLLIKQVTEGLTPVEKKALEAFDLSTVNAKRRELEHLVAALSFGIMANLEAPPPALRASIEQRGLAHVVTAAGMGAENVAAPKPAAPNLSSAVVPPLHRRGGTAGWLAAAACLVLAIIAWMRPVHPVVAPPVAEVHVTVPPAVIKGPVVLPPAPRTAAQERDALLARSETLKVTLNATKDPAGAGVTADVVWDPATQTGFLHLVGLKANDPQVQQYQAWIFDGARDKRYPIDCAIFDVPADTSEVMIPIQVAIPVRSAKAFAVTVEKPGGVVVPDRAHVVVLGAAS